MRIGIFSKIGSSGGSEHRCAEMCNSIIRSSPHSAVLLCEGKLNPIIENLVNSQVEIVQNIFDSNDPSKQQRLYELDSLLIVNSDSYSFSTLAYWLGKSEHHKCMIDLRRIKQMIFLYNFVISPAKRLAELLSDVKDLRIVCGNKSFYEQISQKEEFSKIRHLPRYFLESPIDPHSVSTKKHGSGIVRIGKHSKAHGYKFNAEHKTLIENVNRQAGNRIKWDFMGVPDARAGELREIHNVTLRKEYSLPVKTYLDCIDIFLFFIDWKRNEPWSRAVAEGMMSGCAVLATNRAGNCDQVLHENTGYLCDTVESFAERLLFLIDHPEKIVQFGQNARLYSKQYTSEKIIMRYLDFIQPMNG